MDQFHGINFREVARQLGQSGVAVHTISTNNERATVSSFREIAELSNGKFFLLEQLDELIDLLSVAVAKQANQLLLLQKMMKREGGGQLTKCQIKLLEAAK
jgi:hypothetical protein